jgi:hypothetical protein
MVADLLKGEEFNINRIPKKQILQWLDIPDQQPRWQENLESPSLDLTGASKRENILLANTALQKEESRSLITQFSLWKSRRPNIPMVFWKDSSAIYSNPHHGKVV